MTDFIILGTDTDAGKTTFALLWLAVFGDQYEYWKPIETGPSDTQQVAGLFPNIHVHGSVKSFSLPLAPPRAAQLEGGRIPPACEIAAARPRPATGRHLLLETFGSPFSPLNDHQLQMDLLRLLASLSVLVSSAALGAIGRTLQCLLALATGDVHPAAVILVGREDDFAREQIQGHGRLPVFSLTPPLSWDQRGILEAAHSQENTLEKIRSCLGQTLGETGKREEIPDQQGPALLQRDRKAIWHPYTALADPEPPLLCRGAQDEFLFLEDGRRLIDGISSWWTILHGHRHPRLLAALAEAARAIDHVLFAGVTHRWAVELAELLLRTAPWPGGRVFYSDNGSTAVEVALKMAYQFWCQQGQPGRTLFVAFQGGYHGDTFGAMAVGRDPLFFGRFEPLLFQARIVPLSPERLDEVLGQCPEGVAAVILEPLVQGAGGMRMHTPAQVQQIAEITRSHGTLLIADEVMTGGGRTGTLWAHQSAGIAPDLICAAKTLAGGMLPLAATLAAPHLVQAFDTSDPAQTFFHGHSFTAHPLACAVAAVSWKLLTENPDPAPPRMEAFWKNTLAPLWNLPLVRDVRVCGSIAAVELEVPGGYLAGAGRALRRHCLDRGVFLRPLGSVLYAMPPYCTSQASLEQIAQAMIGAVAVLQKG